MSNNKQPLNHNPNQSSVDWVIVEIMQHQKTFYGVASIPFWLVEQAKAIHRTEIIESYASGSNDRLKNTINTNYYNETFRE